MNFIRLSTSALIVLSMGSVASADFGDIAAAIGNLTNQQCPPQLCGPQQRGPSNGGFDNGDRRGDRGGGGRRGPGQGGPGYGGGGHNGPGYPQPQPPVYQPPRPQPRPPVYQPPRPQPRPPQQGYWQYDTQRIYVGRAVMNEQFYLRQAAGLDGTYRGWEITSVHARTSPNSPFQTVVQLIADGRVIATQMNPGNQINLVPMVPAVLDQNIRTLQMSISGSTVIVDSIEIELRAYRN